MLDRSALRDAIEAVEESSLIPGGAPGNVSRLLGRLYATYAQTLLDQRGVGVDLMTLCGDRWNLPGGWPKGGGAAETPPS